MSGGYLFNYVALMLILYFEAALTVLNVGTQLLWIGPALPILQNEELSPIDVVTDTEASWIYSMIAVGSLPGSLLGAYLANKVGRKNTLILVIIPNSISYLLIIFVKNVYMLYVARFFAGINVGIVLLTVPIYLTEISSPRIRGILGTFLVISITSSGLIDFLVQPNITLQLHSIIMFVFSFISCCVTSYYLPETPHYYIMKDKEELARKSLQKLRQRINVENELFQIKESRVLEIQNKKHFCEYLQTKIIRKSLLMFVLPVVAQQFSGPLPVLGYVSLIVNESIPGISSYYGSIVLNVFFTMGTISSTLFVDKFGRRFLFISSGILLSILSFLIGAYYMFESIYGFEIVSNYSITLFVLLVFYFLIFSFGQFSMVHIYAGELFETHFRATAGLIGSISTTLGSFIVIQLYGIFYRNFGLQYLYLFFAICGILYTFFGYYFLPETKGKSLLEIQKELLIEK